MSVTTGSFGTADAPASSPSLHGLDGVNFFLAAALAGFGPYVPAYLADQKWTQTDIGLVLTVGSIAGLLSQLPGGEVLDNVRSKRAVIAVGASIVILSALILAFWPRLPSVFIALVLQGATGGFLGPAIAAISLGLVGHAALAEQLGRNQRFASTGALAGAALMRLIPADDKWNSTQSRCSRQNAYNRQALNRQKRCTRLHHFTWRPRHNWATISPPLVSTRGFRRSWTLGRWRTAAGLRHFGSHGQRVQLKSRAVGLVAPRRGHCPRCS